MEIMNDIMPQLICMINQAKVSACGRDGVIELLTKFITRKDGVGWSKRFIEVGGKINANYFYYVLFFIIKDFLMLVKV